MGAKARAKGGVGKRRRVEREIRLRCFFFGVWLADADFGGRRLERFPHHNRRGAALDSAQGDAD